MASDGSVREALAAGVAGGEQSHRALLQSVVDVARAIYASRAASIFLLDVGNRELVFEAISGHGEQSLVGMRFPAGQGIAGWVLGTRQPVVVEDVQRDERFASDVAGSTGYMPKCLLASPLLHDEQALGVIEVLDPPEGRRMTAADLDLLGLFANQAAIALDLMQRSRRAREMVEGGEGGSPSLARLAETLEGLEGEPRRRADAVLAAVDELLRA